MVTDYIHQSARARFVTEDAEFEEAVRKAGEGRVQEAVEALGRSGERVWWAVQVGAGAGAGTHLLYLGADGAGEGGGGRGSA